MRMLLCFRPIVSLILGRKVTVQMKAASALESLANNNTNSQRAFLDLDAPKALMKLLKVSLKIEACLFVCLCVCMHCYVFVYLLMCVYLCVHLVVCVYVHLSVFMQMFQIIIPTVSSMLLNN